MTQVRAVIVTLATVAATLGCYTAQPARSLGASESRELFVRFVSTRELDVHTESGVPQRLTDVHALRGRAVRVHADSLDLRIEQVLETPRLRQPTTWRPIVPRLLVTLPLHDRSLRVEEQRLARGQTGIAVVLGALTAAFVALVLNAPYGR
jgi:hypothetical protein